MAPTTTSATRPGRIARKWTEPRRGAPRPAGGCLRCPARAGGFTLIEVVLALSLVAVLLSLGVLALGRWYDSSRLPEGARRLESILRLARADACARGRRVRLQFDPESLAPGMVWEPQPLQEPGVYVQHPAEWAFDLPVALLRVTRCERRGADAVQTLTYNDDEELTTEEGNPLQPVTFYPDGSFESAIIEVAGRDDSELRIGRIDLDGVTGSITLRIMTSVELEEQYELDAEAQEGL